MVDEIYKTSSTSGVDLGHFGGLNPPPKIEHNGGELGFNAHPDFCEVKFREYVEPMWRLQ
jgi:hypothetical protein